ncbi:XRN 5'-3' exonuclease [Bodo saltans virus]|uniref:XRN 5'-3' exonuclease n=1 Tax=Bodo saltans virus TaxID=2024608 RepID=A0A2H4UUU7_9VIRU|nr:XRN 5'-3' exonuclease [Bodo saltans virus]ATZ80701.1 XRN 5'-3' exonuclease [Bodo saltans virus]
MGLPGAFSWILKRYARNILKNNLHIRPKKLYIDGNCLLHPECFAILDANPKDSTKELKIKMFKRIVNALDFIEKYVNPTEMMYIAIDGIAPLAKIIQQRKRRYKSELDKEMKNELKQKFGMNTQSQWSNTCITPGTEFMEELHEYLNNHYKTKKSKIQYIYSSFHTAGEGEHKIMEHIKNETNNDDMIVVYGLDADLIFLSMASMRDNIYLIREKMEFKKEHFHHQEQENAEKKMDNVLNNEKTKNNSTKSANNNAINEVEREFVYVCIQNMKKAYNNEIHNIIEYKKNKIKTSKNFDDIDYSDDLIFLCFLLGNDFLPHFPSIDIHTGGLDELIDSYVTALFKTGEPLIRINNRKVTINSQFFTMICESMGEKEQHYFYTTLYNSEEKNARKICKEEDEYKKQLWEMDNLKSKQKDTLLLGVGEKDVWKYRYYEHYFHSYGSQEQIINDICSDYVLGIVWMTNYYFDKCPDWRWCYIPHYAPFISDIAKYLNDNNINLNDIKIINNKHIPMMSQLVSVLPPSCNYLLPESYKYLTTDIKSEIIDMFPNRIKIDTLYKNQLWQCIPRIPYLDINRILKCTKELKLTKNEKKREMELVEFVY